MNDFASLVSRFLGLNVFLLLIGHIFYLFYLNYCFIDSKYKLPAMDGVDGTFPDSHFLNPQNSTYKNKFFVVQHQPIAIG